MAKDYEGDYQFGAAAQLGNAFRELPNEIVSQDLREIAVAYSTSIDRVVSMHCLPIELAYWADHMAHAVAFARYRNGIPVDSNARDGELNDDIKRASERLLEPTRRMTVQDAANQTWFRGGALIKHFVRTEQDNNVSYIRAGLESLLAAAVILTYAAYETMAADLWVKALNMRPELARNWADKNRDKQLAASVIVGRLDINSQWGDLLRENQKVSFDSLDQIRAAYRDAFKNTVDITFEPFEPLRTAEKTRHLLAHRAGLIDVKFKAAVQSFPPYKDLPLNSRIPLTGPLVGTHLCAIVFAGIALLKQVDAALATQ